NPADLSADPQRYAASLDQQRKNALARSVEFDPDVPDDGETARSVGLYAATAASTGIHRANAAAGAGLGCGSVAAFGKADCRTDPLYSGASQTGRRASRSAIDQAEFSKPVESGAERIDGQGNGIGDVDRV